MRPHVRAGGAGFYSPRLATRIARRVTVGTDK
jgi:hypothetical protein